MKKFSEQLHKKSQSVKLAAVERRELRDRVVSYMEYHPLPNRAPATTTAKKVIVSPFTEKFITVPFSYFARAGAVVALLIMVVIPVLAERAVPGDGLYAVKVRFNEELRSTLALSPYEKIEWETERLNRRIAEARLLASEGRLTEEVEAEVAAAVKEHAENAKREIETLRNEDEEEATLASIALTTTLEVQAASLKDEGTSDNNDESTDEKQTKLLASVVEEVAAQEAATEVGVPGYEKLMARVEINTTRIYELFESLGLTEESEYYQDIQRRLSDINRTVEEATQIRETDENEARLQLVDALQRTQKLIVFMTEIQASQEFTVEEFVPAVLTPEEREAMRTEYQSQTETLEMEIRKARASTTDSAIMEKSALALEQIASLRAKLNIATTTAEINALYEEINNLATDTLAIFATSNSTETETILEPEVPAERGTSSEATSETTTE